MSSITAWHSCPRRCNVSGNGFHKWINTAASLTVIIGLFGGLYSFWYQYEQTRAERTLNLAAKIFEDPLASAQRRFVNELLKLPLDNIRGQKIDRDFVATLMHQVVSESDKPADLRDDIVTIVNFYDRVSACAETGLCRKSLLLEQINPAATRFACWVMPYVRTEREKMLLTGMGDGFSALVDYASNC